MEVQVTWSDGTASVVDVSPAPQVTGETAASICAAIAGPLAKAVQGMCLEDHAKIIAAVSKCIWANTTAKCAIDLAVHAAVGASLKGGGNTGDAKLPAGEAQRSWGLAGLAAWLGTTGGRARTDVTVSLATPGQMAAQAAQRVGEGFDVLKLKLGGDAATDVARTVAVHRAVGSGAALRLDANQAWTADEALTVLDALEAAHIRPELIEQPVRWDDFAGMAAVARRTCVPVMADESARSATDVVRLAELGAASIVNVKLAKCGGLRPAQDVIATATACGLEVIVGCMMEPASTVAAAGLLALVVPTKRAHDLDAGWWVIGTADVGDGGASPGRTAGIEYRPPFVVVGPQPVTASSAPRPGRPDYAGA